MADKSNEEERPPGLVVVGGGVAGCAAARNGAEVTLIKEGLPLGGQTYETTTLPVRVMFAASKDLHRSRAGRFPGTHSSTSKFDWAKFRRFQQRQVHEQSEFLGRDVQGTRGRLVEDRAR